MGKYKIGDRVRFTEHYLLVAKIGDEGTVTKISCNESATSFLYIDMDGGEEVGGCFESRVEKAMNRLKGRYLAFEVEDNPELHKAIMSRMEHLGARNHHPERTNRFPYMLCLDGRIDQCNEQSDSLDECELVTIDYLYNLPEVHTITVDGKEIILSEESFNALKEELCNG